MIVGDDAFPLKTYLMKPYPTRNIELNQRIFNYRLSRVRRIVETVFGILTSRFGFFQKPIRHSACNSVTSFHFRDQVRCTLRRCSFSALLFFKGDGRGSS